MGNLLQYTDKSVTIDNKLRILIAQINYKYKNGEIKTETEYYYKIKNMLKEFYDSLTKPSFKYRPAVTTPISSDYNAMINESYNDMEYIIKDCEALQDYVSQSFIDAQLSRTMMSNQLTYLNNKVNNIAQSIADNQSNGVIIFSDSFNDYNNVGNTRDENSCTIDTFDGILTLGGLTNSNAIISNIEIDNEYSNGFPGNTHCIDTLNADIHFVGQDGLHIDPRAMIDNNQDTWYEFEIFNVDDQVRKDCNSYGFDYEEGVSWVDNNVNLLRLKIRLTLAQAQVCSWVSVIPYVPDAKGGTYCTLEKCEIFSDTNNVYTVAKNVTFNETLTFAFPAQPIAYVELTFIQDIRYLTKVGHYFYTNLDTSKLSIYQNYEEAESYTRIDGPKPSVSMLGLKYDPTTKWVDYTSNTSITPSDTYIKSELFTTPESTIERKSNIEMIDAYRYMIGIKEIRLPQCVFQDESVYVSKIFTTDDVITSVCLETNEYIPEGDTSLLTYYISLDQGSTWYPITPLQRAYDGIYKYYINNDSIENLLTKDVNKFKAQNLSILSETKTIQLKIKMKKPAETTEFNQQATPIVYSYKLKVTTGGETIEY